MAATNNIDGARKNRSELSPRLRLVHEQMQKTVLTNPDYAIQEGEFSSVYAQETIERDVALTKRLRASFSRDSSEADRNTKKVAEVLEGLVLMNSELNNWLGNATTLKSSEYDDYVNGVDMISEWKSPEGPQVLALAVDVTFGSQAVAKKIARIKSEMQAGKLGSIKYFRTDDGVPQPAQPNVPRIVIGVSQDVVDELAGLWLLKDNKALANHPIQKLFLQQMSLQLSHMKRYAQAHGHETCAVECDKAHKIVRRILENKESIRLGDLNTDSVAVALKAEVEKQFAITTN